MAYILASAPSDLQYIATTILVFPVTKEEETQRGLLKPHKMMPLHSVTSNCDSLVLTIHTERRWFVLASLVFLNSCMGMNKLYSI